MTNKQLGFERTDRTMENETKVTMDDFKDEIDASFKRVHEGDLLTGTVVAVTDTEAILDLHSYTEGIVRGTDFSRDPDFVLKRDIQVGDVLTGCVISSNDGHGSILLSCKEASDKAAWNKLQKIFEEETMITAKVKGVVNAGVIVYVEGIRGFVPASKLSLSYVENLDEWLDKELQLRIITLDEANSKLVLSAKEILKEHELEEKKAKISNVKVGLVTEGKVESLMPYGAFVRLADGLSGLVHISQISEKRIKTPSAVLTEGQTVKVKVLEIKDQKISLSMKALDDVASKEIAEEVIDLPEVEDLSTNLGSLLSGLSTFK